MRFNPLSARRRHRAAAGAVAVGAALALGLSACASTGSGTTTAASSSGAVLKWATTYFPADWDPVVNGAGLTDRIAVLYQGELVEVGPSRSIINEPQHVYTRLLIDSAPTLRSAAAKRSQREQLRALLNA
jgi:hypothetical protein